MRDGWHDESNLILTFHHKLMPLLHRYFLRVFCKGKHIGARFHLTIYDSKFFFS